MSPQFFEKSFTHIAPLALDSAFVDCLPGVLSTGHRAPLPSASRGAIRQVVFIVLFPFIYFTLVKGPEDNDYACIGQFIKRIKIATRILRRSLPIARGGTSRLDCCLLSGTIERGNRGGKVAA